MGTNHFDAEGEFPMRYDIILFDADDTLLDFGKAEDAALKQTFAEFGLTLTEEIREGYLEINHGLWKALERGEIEKPQVLARRFQDTFEKFGIPGPTDGSFEKRYQILLGEGAYLVDGAMELLQELKKTHRLAIVTNGVTATQTNRLRLCGLDQVIPDVFISEKIGVAKPQLGFFTAVFAALRQPERSRVLIVGDSLTSDMRGGEIAGIDSCWYNPKGKPNDTAVRPTYEIRDLAELFAIVR